MISALYVDDEPSLLEITRIMLEATREFSISTANSAPEGLEALRKKPFDAIISDYQMPVMDGIEFLKNVRSLFGDIPFLLFTGKGREEIVIEAINCGADFYVQKGGEPQAQFADLMHKVKIAVERKRSRTALQKSENNYRTVIENIQDVFYRCDNEGILDMASPSWAALLGYDSVDECLGKNIAETFWMFPEKRTEFLERISSEGRVENFEIILKHKNGSPVTVSTGSHLFYISERNEFGIEGIFRDISAQKKAEQHLEESRHLQESIVQGLPLPAFVIDKDCRVISWNKALEEYCGIRQEEILGKAEARKAFYMHERPCLADLIVNDTPEEIGRWYKTTPIRSSLIRGAYETTEFFPHMKNGAWITFTAAPIQDREGRVIGAVEILQDITEKRKNDEELISAYSQMQAAFDEAKMSQQLLTEQNWFLNQCEVKYRNIVEASPDMIWEIDAEGIFTYISPQCEQFLGYSTEDLLKTSIVEIIPQEHKDGIRKAIADQIVRKDPLFTLEIPAVSRDGDPLTLEMRSIPVWNADETLLGFRGIARDITERKRGEEQLYREKENFLKIFAAAPVGLVLMDRTRKICRVNGAMLEMVLRDPAEVIGKTGGSGIGCIHSLEDERGCGFSHSCPECPLRRGIESVLEKGGSLHGERIRLELMSRGMHRECFASVSVEPVTLNGNRCVIVAMDDITTNVAMERALRENEARFREIFNKVNDSIELNEVRTDGLPGKYVEVNEVACRMLGYSREELLERGPLDLTTTYHNRCLASIGDDLANTGHSRFETEHRAKDGRIIPVEVNAHLVTIGGAKRVLSVVRDISQRKQADESVHHLRRKIENLAAITRQDIRLNLTTANTINTLLGNTAGDHRFAELLTRQLEALEAIGRQIEFSREFENVGQNMPCWQSLPDIIAESISHHQPGPVQIVSTVESVEIYADRNVERVFFHLVENALRHGMTLTRVQFSSKEHWNDLIITCEDDGVGIPVNEKEKIIERGYGRHTGLGLYLSSEILSLTGIRIHETGTFGHGARFEITVPRAAFRKRSREPAAGSAASPPSAQT
jgi:PAS domain S-box-containing protein